MTDTLIQIPKGMNADSVVQVLEVGLDIVSQDGWWTKGALCTPDGRGCALGALGVAAGVIPPNPDGTFSPEASEMAYYPAGTYGQERPELGVASAMLAEAAAPQSALEYASGLKRLRAPAKIAVRMAQIGQHIVPSWNDATGRRKASVIEAFKKALAEAKQQAEARKES